MTMRRKLFSGAFILVLSSVALLWGQVQPSHAQVLPVPIPGGDVIAPFTIAPGITGPALVNQFFPGVGTGFDGLNADPHGITNFKGLVAMGYTAGTATDNAGKQYNVITDIRVYQGEYVGAEANGGAGRTKSALAHGTFVEI
jgi:hypothetical protein